MSNMGFGYGYGILVFKMVMEIVISMDEFPFDYTDLRLVNADGSPNTDWKLLVPLLQQLLGHTTENLQ